MRFLRGALAVMIGAPAMAVGQATHCSGPVGSSGLRCAAFPTEFGHYHVDVWRAQDSVRLAFTSNLVETRDGYLWLSSQSGLTRFDGVRFTVFNGRTLPPLRGHPDLEIYPLLEDADGALWIGTDDGLFTLTGGQLEPAASVTSVTDQVNAAAQDARGTIWAVTRTGRMLRISRGGAAVEVRGGSNAYAGSGVTVDAADDVWFVVPARGAYRVHHDSVSVVPFPAEAHVDDVRHVVATADTSIWLGMPNAIVLWRHGRFRRITFPSRHALDAVSCLAVGPDGALWIGTQGAGLYRYDGHGFTSFTRRDGLSDDRIADILVDRSGNVWVATRDGLNRLRPVPFDVITEATGLPAELPGGMVRDGTGGIWLAPPTGGLFRGRVSGGHVVFTQVEPVSHGDRINVLAAGRDGSVWAGRLGGSITQFGATGERAREERVGGAVPVTAVLEDSDGTLWAGTVNGLIRFQKGQRRVFTTRDGLPDNVVQRLYKDTGGTLWVATQKELARKSSDGDEHFVAPPMPAGAGSRALVFFEKPRGTLWVGTAQGVARVTGGPPVLVSTARGLPDDWVGAVEDDGTGHLWLGQLEGLTRVDETDLAAVADGRKPALTTVASFEALDGLPGGDPSGWCHPWSFRDAQGLLWFAMGHGLVRVDPGHVERDVHAPLMHLEQLNLDGTLWPPPVDSSVTIGPGVRRLEIRYTGVDLANGPGVRFRYRLDGFDTGWTDVGAQRRAVYTRLAPGRYRFRVIGRAAGGEWSPTEAAMDIVVGPPFYLRVSFLATVLAIVLAFLWSAHRTVLLTRSAAIRDERSRLAREIHDSLLQGFGAIALQLHAASARLSLQPSEQSVLDRILGLVDQTLRHAREIVWDIRTPGAAGADLSAECDDAAARILATTDTRARVTCRGRARRLSRRVQTEALRVIEEALTNIRKHAAATEVGVHLDYRWLRLTVTVTDNGRGFDAGRERTQIGHWGLLGMRERASRIGARFSVESKRQSGTVVTLDVPYG